MERKRTHQESSNEIRVSTMDHLDEKRGRQHHEGGGGKRQRHGATSICRRIIRNHILNHEEMQGEYSSEASQHHQEVTVKTKRQS